MPNRVLKRAFYGPDGRLYHRINSDGEVLVHKFPDGMILPSTARDPLEEIAAAPEAEPEPVTLSEIAKAVKPTARAAAAEG